MNETNRVLNYTPTSTDIDKKALAEALRNEKEQIKKGYRWIDINSRLKIFVECDENGNPTEKGKKQIEIATNHIKR